MWRGVALCGAEGEECSATEERGEGGEGWVGSFCAGVRWRVPAGCGRLWQVPAGLGGVGVCLRGCWARGVLGVAAVAARAESMVDCPWSMVGAGADGELDVAADSSARLVMDPPVRTFPIITKT